GPRGAEAVLLAVDQPRQHRRVRPRGPAAGAAGRARCQTLIAAAEGGLVAAAEGGLATTLLPVQICALAHRPRPVPGTRLVPARGCAWPSRCWSFRSPCRSAAAGG